MAVGCECALENPRNILTLHCLDSIPSKPDLHGRGGPFPVLATFKSSQELKCGARTKATALKKAVFVY